MSFVIAAPETLVRAASDLANIGSTLGAANAAALGPTTELLAAGADEVSAAIASLFAAHWPGLSGGRALRCRRFMPSSLHTTHLLRALARTRA
ncbi:PE-PGRS family protein, partial [Mycobacterium tuberculosis C]